MLCDKCKKNEATIHIKEFHNGKCSTVHLCAKCAKMQNGPADLDEMDLMSLLCDLNQITMEKASAAAGTPEKQKARSPETDKVCPKCHWTLAKISEHGGLLGCPECYRTFADDLQPMLTENNRSTIHLGKRPRALRRLPLESQLAMLSELRTKLQELLSREEYEAAAVCRDQILAIAGNQKQDDAR